MNQEITLSENIFKYLYKEIRNFGNICEIIEQNSIVVDKDNKLPNSYIKVIDALENNYLKEEIERIFVDWFNNRIIEKEIENENYGKNKKLLDLVVCNESEDKILFEPFDEEYNKKRLKINFSFGNKIEIHNTKSFLKQEHFHRLKNIPTEINLKKGEKYDLAKILEPFLKEAERVEFHDPYLMNEKATKSMLKVLGICKKVKEIVLMLNPELKNPIRKNSNPKYSYQEDFKNFMDRIKEYLPIIKIKYYPIITNVEGKESLKHQERYIHTEKFKIYIPGGLDQFDERWGYGSEEGELKIKFNED